MILLALAHQLVKTIQFLRYRLPPEPFAHVDEWQNLAADIDHSAMQRTAHWYDGYFRHYENLAYADRREGKIPVGRQ